MNTLPALKLIPILSRLALTGLVAFFLGLALDAQALALFAFTTSTLFLLIVAHDYAPRKRTRVSVAATVIDFPTASDRAETSHRIAA